MKEIAKLPHQRKLWWIRSYYRVLPTDERYLNLTPEQIELEFQHYIMDNPDKFKEVYTDPEYEEWERKTSEEDEKLLLDNEDWEEVSLDP